ncbi:MULTISPECIES: prolipoprotein diacylglyceryl transferase [Microbacterium]|uniref:Phosphatidylglycerol--prolipoprotein diacylglyceryl transferase n=2 Tax=Microbacterium TaxID=33882 RepID=A0AAU0MIL2_9MICO|nr:prolipoprotein diacylglyceryl transferase [Microbacterium sp. Y20]WOQ69852.1 prolipoprotein diacylglyceryl transferase [Microbacterium sp. Y20]
MIGAFIPSPDVTGFAVGPFTIRFYAVFIIAGIVIAVWLTSHRLRQRGAPAGVVVDVALWAVPAGIVGGRLYHVLTHPADYFYEGADLWRVLYVWEGGLAIFGAILAGSVAAWLACRRAGIRFLSFADALAPGLLIAQAIGRWGNYVNQELFGAPTTLPWGLQIDPANHAFPPGLPPDTLFHPLFLYEMLWNLAGAAAILLIERRVPLRWGKALGAYLIVYGTGRAWLEALRLDPTGLLLWGVKVNLLMAALIAVAGVALIVVQSRRHPEPEPSPYLPGRAPTPGATVPGPPIDVREGAPG